MENLMLGMNKDNYYYIKNNIKIMFVAWDHKIHRAIKRQF